MLPIRKLILSVGLLAAAFACFVPARTAWAQTAQQAARISVAGKVVDETGEPLMGASVFVKGTNNGTVTDLDGQYSLSVPAGSVLEVSFMGYETQNVTVSTSGRVDVVLQPDSDYLNEVVVVGYGIQKKVDLSGSVSVVNGDQITSRPAPDALSAIQGAMPGVQVLRSSGEPGSETSGIRVRGFSSANSTSTLVLIDGVEGDMTLLNPNDIESISILKDASATSIYGSRAANGVVHIITKAGAYNNDATVTVRSQWGISTITDKSLYENMMSSDELARFWNVAGVHSEQYVKETFYDNGYTADTKWYNYVQQFNNPQYQNDISVEGGGQRVAYMIGASQFHQRGQAIGNVYDRYTLRSNIQGRPKDWLKLGMNTNVSYDKNVQNPNWSNSSNNRNYTSGALSYLTLPFYPAIDPETGKEYENEYPGGMINHHTYMANRVTPTERLSLNGSIFATIDFTRNLRFSSRAGVDGYISRYTGVMKPDYYLMGGSGWRSRSTTYSYSSSLTNTLEYSFNFGENHKFTALLGHEEIFNDYDYWAGSSEEITTPGITLIQSGNPETFDVSESQSTSAFRSFFGHVDYTMYEKYIFDFALRYDASSRFGANNRWAPFWSAGALWKLKKESFLRSTVWVNDLNFKVSYGTQGNASIGNYDRLGLIGGTASYGGRTVQYFAQPESPDLKWEQQALLTIALTGKVLDKFDFDISWYHRKTTDMLMDVPIPTTVGFSSQTRNVGALLNKGVDITLGYDIVRARDHFFRVQTTFNYNQEKVLELFDGRDRWEITNTGVAFVVGHPVMYYYPIYAGVNRDNGMPTWYVPGENIDEITMNEVTEDFDEATLTQNTGLRRHAPIYGGFSLQGGWKRLSVVADFSYVLGKYMTNNDAYFYANPNNFTTENQHKSISDFWTENNKDAQWPDWRKGAFMQFDTHLVEDASFMRLKNLQVGYSLPMGDKMAKVFRELKVTFTGRNILTFTKYSGIDPEDDTNVSLGLPANSKQYLFGLEFTF